MTLYRYEAVDRAGNVVHGAMDAPDEQAVSLRLTNMGYAAKGIIPAPGNRAASYNQPKSTPTAPKAGGVPISVKSAIPIRSLSIFFRQLAISSRAGIPIFQSLTDTRMRTSNRKLTSAVDIMIDRTRSGNQLSSSMAEFPHLFPVWATSLVWAGELGGFREDALADVAAKLEAEAAETRYARLGWAIFKINLISLILTIPIANIGKMLGAMIASETQSFGGRMQLMWDQVKTPFWHAAVPMCIMLCIWWEIWGILKRQPGIRAVLDSMLLQMPVWGTISRERSISRFLMTLEKLYQTGVPPKQCWDAASLTAYNSDIATRLKASGYILGQSNPLIDAFANSGVLPMEETGLIQAAERAGQIPETLAQMAVAHNTSADHTRTIGKMWSISLQISAMLLATGIVVIIMAKTYSGLLGNMLDPTKLGF